MHESVDVVEELLELEEYNGEELVTGVETTDVEIELAEPVASELEVANASLDVLETRETVTVTVKPAEEPLKLVELEIGYGTVLDDTGATEEGSEIELRVAG